MHSVKFDFDYLIYLSSFCFVLIERGAWLYFFYTKAWMAFPMGKESRETQRNQGPLRHSAPQLKVSQQLPSL